MGSISTEKFIYEEIDEDEDEFKEDEIELVVQGRTISVSERLLCEKSTYFQNIFTQFDNSQETIILKHQGLDGQNVPEDKQQEPLGQISFITMTTIIDFIYTGELKVNEQNVKQLLYASDLLAMCGVETECFNYLTKHLNIKNCIRRYLLACSKPAWISLANDIREYIVQHFDTLVKSSAIFKLLDVMQFKEIISSHNLSVNYEEQVYDAVFNWVLVDSNHRRVNLQILFQEIQWPLIRSPKYYTDTLNDPFVMDNVVCARIMEAADEYFHLSYAEKLEYWRTRQKPTRWPKLMLVLSYAEKLIEAFDFEEENWFVITEKPGYVFGSCMCYLNGKLYTLGGVQSKSVDQYDVEADQWKDFFPSLRHCRVAHSVAVSQNKIFVAGGSAKANANFGPGLYEMEMMSLDAENKLLHDWRVAGTMKEGRSFLGCVSGLDGRVYSVGGCLSECFSTMEVWSPDTGRFSEAAKSLTKRDSQGQVLLNGEVYSVGGYDNLSNKYLNSVEKYNPDTNTWSTVPAMHVGRRSPGVVNYRNRLYVVGGMGVDDDLNSLEVYNPTTQEWRMLTPTTKEVSGWVSACLVDKPVRLMVDTRVFSKSGADKGFCNLIPTGGLSGLDLDTFEYDGLSSRRESLASSTSGCGSGDTPTEKLNFDWKSTENARTEQRMKKHRKELQ